MALIRSRGDERNTRASRPNMLLHKLFYLWIGQCRKINPRSGDDPLGDRRMMLLQVFEEKVCCAARSGCMSEDYDLLGVRQIFRDLFVEGKLLGNPLPLIMRFFAVDQVALKSKGVVWFDGGFFFRSAFILILINARRMMIDNHNRSSWSEWLNRRFLKSSFVQKPAKTGNLFHFEIVRMRTLEECPLRPHHKRELVMSMWLDFTDLPNQVHNIAPRQIARKLAIEQTA